MNGRSEHHRAGDESTTAADLPRQLEVWLRVAGQGVGLVLIVLVSYYLFSLFLTLVRFLNAPAEMEASVAAVSELIGAQGMTIQVAEQSIAVGRTVALLVLVPWYILCVWLLIKLLGVGVHLVLGVVNERREFLATMKEFLKTMREPPAGGPPPGKT